MIRELAAFERWKEASQVESAREEVNSKVTKKVHYQHSRWSKI